MKGLVTIELSKLDRLLLAELVRMVFGLIGRLNPAGQVSPATSAYMVMLFSNPTAKSIVPLPVALEGMSGRWWPGRTTSHKLYRSQARYFSDMGMTYVAESTLGDLLEFPGAARLPDLVRLLAKLAAAASPRRGKRPRHKDREIVAMVEAVRAVAIARRRRVNALDEVASQLGIDPTTVLRAIHRHRRRRPPRMLS